MTDDNVSFTDAGDKPTPSGSAGGSSAMLDLLGTMNKEDKKKESKEKKKKSKKTKTKKVRKADKFESQNFLFRIEGAPFCAAITVGVGVLIVFIIVFIVFLILTNANLVSYMQPLWGSTAESHHS